MSSGTATSPSRPFPISSAPTSAEWSPSVAVAWVGGIAAAPSIIWITGNLTSRGTTASEGVVAPRTRIVDEAARNVVARVRIARDDQQRIHVQNQALNASAVSSMFRSAFMLFWVSAPVCSSTYKVRASLRLRRVRTSCSSCGTSAAASGPVVAAHPERPSEPQYRGDCTPRSFGTR